MSEYEKGYRVGYGDGEFDRAGKDADSIRDSYWCGVAFGLATWPLAAIAYVLWRTFA